MTAELAGPGCGRLVDSALKFRLHLEDDKESLNSGFKGGFEEDETGNREDIVLETQVHLIPSGELGTKLSRKSDHLI